MGIDRVVLELMERIQILEDKIAKLESERSGFFMDKGMSVANTVGSAQNEQTIKAKRKTNSLTQAARDYINHEKAAALDRGLNSITLLCNDIQKALGVTNRTPCVCNAMYDCMTNPKDRVISAPPSGKSTTVLVEYCLLA